MTLKTYIAYASFLSLTLFTTTISAQSLKDASIVKADTTWGKEIIKFPVEWAPAMTLEGFEELRFSPGWSDKDSNQFWTYVLAWNVTATTSLTAAEIEHNLEAYFDGLMKPNHWARNFPEPLVHIAKTNNTANGVQYQGKMKYFDGFHTGKMITTNIMAEQIFCTTTQKTIVVFRISPKEFDHEVWNDLATVTTIPVACDILKE